MPDVNDLHIYQRHVVEHIIANPSCGIFLDMGLGKTIITLTAISELLYDLCEVSKVLIIAPKRVARDTWSDEIGKWDHLKHLRVSKILGTESQRITAFRAKADVYVISRDSICWLITFLGGAFPFDTVIVDESSSFKSPKAARFKALRRVCPLIKRMILLTGTPAPNGLMDLWSQIYLLDQGKRLGENITNFREAFFHAPYRHQGVVVGGYKLKGGESGDISKNPNARDIFGRIKDICISMKAADWLELPARVDTVNSVKLSSELMRQYKTFEKEKVLEFIEALGDKTVNAVNAASLTNKLLQFANGALYTDTGIGAKGDNREYIEIHNEKIDALEEVIEAANGNPMLVAYSFRHDLWRIQKHLKHLKPRLLDSAQDMRDWNAGKIPFALGHSQSLGHGLNLQAGGNLMAWFGLTWSLEYYQQFVKRIDRQGQTKSVINQRLLCAGTMDYEVLSVLEGKDASQEALMQAVKALVKKYKT